MPDLADTELAAWVDEARTAGPASFPPDVTALRLPRERAPGPEQAAVGEPAGAPVPVRRYEPYEKSGSVILFVHGGLFVAGDLDSHDRTCRRLATATGATVVATDYRRAPEHPAPAAIDDVVAAWGWAAAALGGAPGLAGDSAGGLIALMAALVLARAGDTPGPLLLACPNADLTLAMPSVSEKGAGWGLDAEAVRWCIGQWAPGSADLERLSPMHADLRGAPPCVVATAEHDPLRDEGEALAERLRAAGGEVELVRHPRLVHGFLSLDDISPAARAAGEALFARYAELLKR